MRRGVGIIGGRAGVAWTGCTNVIQPARSMAIAFSNRGSAYHDEKAHDCAIADGDVAIKLAVRARCRSATRPANDAIVLCMLRDTGERDLSRLLSAGIPIDMTEGELGISRSTPSSQLKPLA